MKLPNTFYICIRPLLAEIRTFLRHKTVPRLKTVIDIPKKWKSSKFNAFSAQFHKKFAYIEFRGLQTVQNTRERAQKAKQNDFDPAKSFLPAFKHYINKIHRP